MMIKAQDLVNKNRIKRANVILGCVGNVDEDHIDNAVKKGTEILMKLSKEQIIYKYTDALDLIMIGIFDEN